MTFPYNQIYVLTGGISSGKSSTATYFSELGAVVISADELARQAVEPGSPCLGQIIEVLGRGFLTPEATLDRKKLGELVFSHPESRTRLEGILHPEIERLAALRFEAALKLAPPLTVYDCPLYFEAGLSRLGFKGVILVYTTPELQIERTCKRDNLSPEQARMRLSSQIPLSKKRDSADYIIENTGTLGELQASVQRLFSRLTS
jgi:dephospho-CoA kinase